MMTINIIVCAANVTVAGVTYALFTHVHHHYGLNDAFDSSVATLLMQQTARTRSLLQVRVGLRPQTLP